MESNNMHSDQMGQKRTMLIPLLIMLVVVAIGGYFINTNIRNVDQDAAATNAKVADTKVTAIDPVLLAKVIEANPYADEVTVQDKNGKLVTQTVPKKVMLAGGTSNLNGPTNDIWESGNNLASSWTNISPNNSASTVKWSTRKGQTITYFKNKLWVIGGLHFPCTNPCGLNDVWSSADGINWTQVTPHAPFGGRHDHTTVVMGGKIYVMGGNNGMNNDYNDVWSSADGINWVQSTASGPIWSKRSEHTSVVFQNKIWVIGGSQNNNTPALNDVWSSPDGNSWTQVTSGAPWSGRYGHTSVVFQNKIWVIGGGNQLGDVWSSSDGTNWTQTATGQFNGITMHTSFVFGNKIWAMGGFDMSGEVSNIWSSLDGITWTLVTSTPGWMPRYEHASVKVPVTFGQTACAPASRAYVKITSPNGGEVYQPGQQVTVTWTSCNIPANTVAKINLLPVSYNGNTIPVPTQNIFPLNSGSTTFTLPSQTSFPPLPYGSYYKFHIDFPSLSVVGDDSDNFFAINNNPSCAITNFTANPTVVSSGGSSTLTWTTNCVPPVQGMLSWTDGSTGGGAMFFTPNGSQTTGPLTATTVYTLTYGTSTSTVTLVVQ